MAADDRTEPPTQKRRRKARQEGQVARSSELVGAAMLFGLLWSLPALMPRFSLVLSDHWRRSLSAAGAGSLGPASLGDLAVDSLAQLGLLAGPVVGFVAAAALLSNLAQVGWHFNAGFLQPRLSRLDPARGLMRLFTGRSLVELAKGLIKLAIVAYVGWLYYKSHRDSLFALGTVFPQCLPACVAFRSIVVVGCNQ